MSPQLEIETSPHPNHAQIVAFVLPRDRGRNHQRGQLGGGTVHARQT